MWRSKIETETQDVDRYLTHESHTFEYACVCVCLREEVLCLGCIERSYQIDRLPPQQLFIDFGLVHIDLTATNATGEH